MPSFRRIKIWFFLFQETSAIEDYVKSIDKLDNLRSNINRLRDDLELSSRSIDEKLEESSRCVRGDVSPSRSIRGDVSPSRSIRGDVELSRSLRGDTELSRSYRLWVVDSFILKWFMEIKRFKSNKFYDDIFDFDELST